MILLNSRKGEMLKRWARWILRSELRTFRDIIEECNEYESQMYSWKDRYSNALSDLRFHKQLIEKIKRGQIRKNQYEQSLQQQKKES